MFRSPIIRRAALRVSLWPNDMVSFRWDSFIWALTGLLVLSGAGPALGASPVTLEPVHLTQSSGAAVSVEVTAPMPVIELRPVENSGPAGHGLSGGSQWSVLTVAGWTRTGNPGAPELPTTGFRLAVPPGTIPVLDVRVLSSAFVPATPAPTPSFQIREVGDDLPPVQLADSTPDPAAYARAYPEAWARLGRMGMMRHLQVVSVEVCPYRWDPQAGGVQVATKLSIEVRFRPLSGVRSGGALPNQKAVVSEPAIWQRAYRQSIVNYQEARSWGRAPRLWQRTMERNSNSNTPEFRITVDHADIYRVTRIALREAGWDTTAVPVDQLALVERFYVEADSANPFHETSVPIEVRDRNDNGLFDGTDDLLFFGVTAWDRLRPPAHERRYGRVNSYFLSLRPEGGARMAVDASYLGRSDLLPESTSVWTKRFEGDGEYMRLEASGDTPGILEQGVLCIKREHSYWFGGNPNLPLYPYQVPFDLPGFIAPLRLRVALQGILKPEGGVPSCKPVLAVGPSRDSLTTLPGPISFGHLTSYLYQVNEGDLQNLGLRSSNWFQMINPEDGWGAGVDWIEWTYRHDFTAAAGRRAWNTGSLTGPREFRVSGFSLIRGDSLLVFDLTDSARVGTTAGPRLLSTFAPGQRVRGTDNKWTLRLQLDLAEHPGPRTLLALAASSAAAPLQIEQTGSDDLTVPPPEGDEELVIMAHPDFMAGIQPLATQRRLEGLNTRVVSVRDVFDQFNGGRAWPTAIRNYLRYLFRTRGVDPSFLLLVGDGSDDFANVLRDSGKNFVPTQTLFSNSSSTLGKELASSDEWFVDNLSGTGEELDFLPDMHIGRLPVGSQAELTVLVNKILQYGVYRETDTWRGRGLLISDDEFSSRLSFTDVYKHRPEEATFRWAGRDTRQIIQEAAGFADFRVDSFYTGAYMDTMACLGRCANPITDGSAVCNERWRCPLDAHRNLLYGFSPDSLCYAYPGDDILHDNYDYGRMVLPPLLRAKMSRGHLFVSYQGHANARLMSHEYIFQDAPFSDRADAQLLQNLDKPFFFMGYGCHLAEFSVYNEGAGGRGDCISEKLLLLDQGRGAIASFASTGYEWLNENPTMDLALFESWFVDPPVLDGHARWILGEIVTGGKYRMMAEGAGYSLLNREGMVATYTLLGDPSMPLDVAAPRMQVELNGQAWEEGQPVAAEAGSDTLRIRIHLQDEVSLARISVTEGGVAVDSSRYVVLPDPERPTDPRRAVLVYQPRLQPPIEDYTIEVKTVDGSGRERTVDFPVSLGARFQVVRDGVAVDLKPADILESGDSVLVRVESPVDLTTDQLALWLDDLPLTGLALSFDNPRTWRLRGGAPANLNEARHALRLRVRRADGEIAERSATFLGPTTGRVRLLEVYNFPNPFEGGTQFHYRLDGSAAWARLTIFTLSGRRIWRANGTARPNDNVIEWDGRDADGDPVSNGLYYYKLEVKTADGKTLSKIERVARIR
jgi:hypothetical protein